MAIHRKHPAHENHERWLVSYADFITLLFAFFVVMFASSQTDKARARQVSEAVQKALDNGRTIGLPPAVAQILGGTVDEKGIGNAMMKGPGGSQRSPKEAPPDSVLELIPSLRRLNAELEQEVREGKLEVKLKCGNSLALISCHFRLRDLLTSSGGNLHEYCAQVRRRERERHGRISPGHFRRPMLYPTELQARAGIIAAYRTGGNFSRGYAFAPDPSL